MSLVDNIIRNQVLVERYKMRTAGILLALIATWDRALVNGIRGDDLADLPPGQVDKVLFGLGQHWDSSSKDVISHFQEELIAFGILQAGARASIVLNGIEVSPSVIRRSVLTMPSAADGLFLGKTIPEMLALWSDRAKEAVLGRIKRGVFESETNSSLIKAIRGTVALNRRDGVFDGIRRSSRAVSNTVVQQAMSAALEKVDSAAGVGHILWLSMLERRTCAICRSMDGKIFEINKGPRPPAHISCRCIGVPLPAGWKKIASNGTRAAQSAFGTQQVALTETYYTWLKRQPPSFVEDVLGKNRGALFLKGGISAEQFSGLQLDRNYQPITLEELRKLIPRTFSRAGI